MRRVRVVCVARKVIKAQFVMTVSSSFKARLLVAHCTPREPARARESTRAELPAAVLQVADARAKIQKIFSQWWPQSSTQLISCAALPPPLHRRPRPFSLFSFAARG